MINNYAKAANGTIDLREAIQYSSNTYFAGKIQQAGLDAMIETNKIYVRGRNSFWFNSCKISRFWKFNFGIDPAVGAFGQGKVLVTPLQVALFTSEKIVEIWWNLI